MERWDYIERYNAQPAWLRVILFPILVPVMLLHGAVGMAIFLLILVPYFSVRGWIENRRFWRKLRERDQIGLWPEVQPQVASGSGTLIVEVTPKGPGCSWLIGLPRETVDPEHVVPSWQQFEQQGWRVFESAPIIEAMNRWAVERLGDYETSARALVPSRKQLAELGAEAKRQSVLAVVGWCEGCLSSRFE